MRQTLQKETTDGSCTCFHVLTKLNDKTFTDAIKLTGQEKYVPLQHVLNAIKKESSIPQPYVTISC